jgi:hypothetical protein
LIPIQPLELISRIEQLNELKFYSALARFQNHHRSKKPETDLEGLRFLASNPLNLSFYYHSSSISENITSHSLIPVQLKIPGLNLQLSVRQVDQFYEVAGTLNHGGATHELHKLVLKYDYFLFLEGTLYLIDNPDYLRVIEFFSKRNHKIIIHQSKYNEFQETVLAKLETGFEFIILICNPQPLSNSKRAVLRTRASA